MKVKLNKSVYDVTAVQTGHEVRTVDYIIKTNGGRAVTDPERRRNIKNAAIEAGILDTVKIK
ncbi:hypothetical protein FACS189447_07830 [Spirochaetia bacterium]|nr:hypothetical protein FACS189447_07830 [Spirochaetia bacterium]